MNLNDQNKRLHLRGGSRMKFSLTKSLMAIAIIALLAACGANELENNNNAGSDDTGEKEVLTMATSADYPPFETYNAEGEIVGFDIDIANLIAEELGYELKIEDMSFDGLVGALQAGRADIVMAGMNSSEDRKQNVDFSVDYHHSMFTFLSSPDAPVESLEDLEGHTVGVQLGTVQEEGAKLLAEEYGFEVKSVDDNGILIQELNTGRIVAGYMDKTVADGYLAEGDLVAFDDTSTSTPGTAVAFPKGSELVDDVNQVLEELIDSGKIAELEEKWEINQ